MENMSNLSTFGSDINAFKNGVLNYSYSFNSVGNLFFKEEPDNFNEAFLIVPTKPIEYDYSKLVNIMNLNFTEFIITLPTSSITTNTEDESQISQLTTAVSSSMSQLSSLQDQNTYTLANEQSNRLEIVRLRILAGEGTDQSQFDRNFPFARIPSGSIATFSNTASRSLT